jgi:aldehyde dehydrogenase (NAD+)
MAACLQSGSQSHVEEVAARIEAGVVYLNGASEDPEAPFGGCKISGNRRERGEIAFGEFLETKAAIRAA